MPPDRHGLSPWAAVVPSLVLYAVALGLPALEFASHEPVRGYDALLWGWWGLLTFDFPWLANPIYFLAILLVLVGLRKVGQVLSAVAFALGWLSLGVKKWWFAENEGTPVENLGSAFYFWMASFLVLGVILFFVRERQAQKKAD
jgi:hypothetical protein